MMMLGSFIVLFFFTPKRVLSLNSNLVRPHALLITKACKLDHLLRCRFGCLWSLLANKACVMVVGILGRIVMILLLAFIDDDVDDDCDKQGLWDKAISPRLWQPR